MVIAIILEAYYQDYVRFMGKTHKSRQDWYTLVGWQVAGQFGA